MRVMLGRRFSSLRDGGGGVRGGFSLPYLLGGGVIRGVDSSPGAQRFSCGEDEKGSISPSHRVWTIVGKSVEGRAETETQERGAGRAEGGGQLVGLGL